MIIARYLTKEVLQTLSAVMLVLLLVFLSQFIVRYLNYAASGRVPAALLPYLIGFEIPHLLAILLPLGLYLGILLSFGRLYADNEMLVLHACGFSVRQLFNLTGLLSLGVASILLLLMLGLNPLVAAKREAMIKSSQATDFLIQTLMPGRFQASPDGRRVVYVEKLSRNRKQAENIFIAEEKSKALADEKKSWVVVLAEHGYESREKNLPGRFLVAADGYRYEGMPGQNNYKLIQFKKYAVRLPGHDATITHQEDEALPTLAILKNYQNTNNAAELQWRVSIAISAFLLGLLAVVLGCLQFRRGRYFVLLPAVVIYIAYMHILFVARHWVEQHTVPVSLGMWWVHGMMILLLVGLFFWQKTRNRA